MYETRAISEIKHACPTAIWSSVSLVYGRMNGNTKIDEIPHLTIEYV